MEQTTEPCFVLVSVVGEGILFIPKSRIHSYNDLLNVIEREEKLKRKYISYLCPFIGETGGPDTNTRITGENGTGWIGKCKFEEKDKNTRFKVVCCSDYNSDDDNDDNAAANYPTRTANYPARATNYPFRATNYAGATGYATDANCEYDAADCAAGAVSYATDADTGPDASPADYAAEAYDYSYSIDCSDYEISVNAGKKCMPACLLS